MLSMHALAGVLQALASDEDGLTLAEILADIPHDPAAVFTYVMLVGCIAGILWIGRPRRPRSPGGAT